MFFHSVGNNNPNWLSYFSEGLKPPTIGLFYGKWVNRVGYELNIRIVIYPSVLDLFWIGLWGKTQMRILGPIQGKGAAGAAGVEDVHSQEVNICLNALLSIFTISWRGTIENNKDILTLSKITLLCYEYNLVNFCTIQRTWPWAQTTVDKHRGWRRLSKAWNGLCAELLQAMIGTWFSEW